MGLSAKPIWYVLTSVGPRSQLSPTAKQAGPQAAAPAVTDNGDLQTAAVEAAFVAAWAEQPSGRTRGVTPDQALAQVRGSESLLSKPWPGIAGRVLIGGRRSLSGAAVRAPPQPYCLAGASRGVRHARPVAYFSKHLQLDQGGRCRNRRRSCITAFTLAVRPSSCHFGGCSWELVRASARAWHLSSSCQLKCSGFQVWK